MNKTLMNEPPMNTTPTNPTAMNPGDLRRHNRTRIQQLAGKTLDAFDRVLDALAAAPDNKPSCAIVRRQTANLLGLSKLCARSTCRRARSCRGEPLDCLRTVSFLLPPDLIESRALTRRRPRRRAAPTGRRPKQVSSAV